MAICGKCQRDAADGALFCAFCGAPIKPETSGAAQADPLIGQTVSGKYFIHQLLGRGGMGDVYKATHLTLDRPVVLKLLKKLFHSDPSLVQRFHREARAASRLNHPNSITIIDFGQTDDGTLFMAMEYLAGRSLERVIAEEYPLPEARIVHVAAQILAALAEAHALGIIHRDLKPANVMLETRRDESDFVKVLDFGIAKLNEPGSGGAGLTQAGIVCGTPGYMSPEQVRGEELDARSDVYAVGVILYEMLTGLLPFESSTPMGLVTKHLVEDAPPPAVRRPGLEVSPALEAIVMRALARDREHRFASADDMRAELLQRASAPSAGLRPTPPPSSTMIFDPSALPASARREPSGAMRIVEPGRRPSSGGVRAEPPPPAVPRTPAPHTEVLATPAPARPAPPPPTPAPAAPPRAAPRTPAPRTPAPAKRTPAPAKRASSSSHPAAPARRTPVAAPAAPRHEMDEPDEGDDAAPPPPARAQPRSKVPVLAAAGAVAVVLVGAGVWAFTRGPSSPPAPTQAKPAPIADAAPSRPTPPAPAATPPAPAPAPAPSPRPEERRPEVVATTAETRPPPRAEPPAPEPEPAPAPRKGIRLVRGDLNSIPTPGAKSGDGVLAVVASPWAEVSIDGKEIGETPREIRLGAGSYRVRVTHPALGTREQNVVIQPGRRQVWSTAFAK
jgi:serine/threonine-protein kinase